MCSFVSLRGLTRACACEEVLSWKEIFVNWGLGTLGSVGCRHRGALGEQWGRGWRGQQRRKVCWVHEKQGWEILNQRGLGKREVKSAEAEGEQILQHEQIGKWKRLKNTQTERKIDWNSIYLVMQGSRNKVPSVLLHVLLENSLFRQLTWRTEIKSRWIGILFTSYTVKNLGEGGCINVTRWVSVEDAQKLFITWMKDRKKEVGKRSKKNKKQFFTCWVQDNQRRYRWGRKQSCKKQQWDPVECEDQEEELRKQSQQIKWEESRRWRRKYEKRFVTE